MNQKVLALLSPASKSPSLIKYFPLIQPPTIFKLVLQANSTIQNIDILKRKLQTSNELEKDWLLSRLNPHSLCKLSSVQSKSVCKLLKLKIRYEALSQTQLKICLKRLLQSKDYESQDSGNGYRRLLDLLLIKPQLLLESQSVSETIILLKRMKLPSISHSDFHEFKIKLGKLQIPQFFIQKAALVDPAGSFPPLTNFKRIGTLPLNSSDLFIKALKQGLRHIQYLSMDFKQLKTRLIESASSLRLTCKEKMLALKLFVLIYESKELTSLLPSFQQIIQCDKQTLRNYIFVVSHLKLNQPLDKLSDLPPSFFSPSDLLFFYSHLFNNFDMQLPNHRLQIIKNVHKFDNLQLSVLALLYDKELRQVALDNLKLQKIRNDQYAKFYIAWLRNGSKPPDQFVSLVKNNLNDRSSIFVLKQFCKIRSLQFDNQLLKLVHDLSMYSTPWAMVSYAKYAGMLGLKLPCMQKYQSLVVRSGLESALQKIKVYKSGLSMKTQQKKQEKKIKKEGKNEQFQRLNKSYREFQLNSELLELK